MVATGAAPASCLAAAHMTASPHTVCTTDAASIALSAMITGRFRHVPVSVPAGGTPCLLDLKRCLFDVIAMAESAQAAGK